MDFASQIRGLRVAWTAFFAVLGIVILGLWVRSSRYLDVAEARGVDHEYVSVISRDGGIELGVRPDFGSLLHVVEWTAGSVEFRTNRLRLPCPRFSYERLNSARIVLVPYWSLTFVTAALIAVPWIRWSWGFGVRTFLMAVTLIVVLLGLAIGNR